MKLPIVNGNYFPKKALLPNGELNKDKEYIMVANSELLEDEQVKTEITYATNSQKAAYTRSYSETQKGKSTSRVSTDIYYDACLKRHVKKIDNLSMSDGKAITTGYQLVACESYFLNDLKQDLFMHICGYNDNDDEGAGELSEEKN